MRYYFLLFSAAVLLGSCGQKKEDKRKDSDAAKAEYVAEKNVVDTVVLRQRNFNKQIVGNGKLRAATKSVLRFGTSGDISEIRVASGGTIRQGEVIACLDPRSAQLRLEQAHQTLDKAEIDRIDALISFGYSDTTDVPKERRRIADIRSGYASAVNSLKQAEIDLANTTLKAPFTGKIANLEARVYEKTGDAFCTLIDDRAFDVDFNLLESEIGFTGVGQTVKMAAFNAPNHYYNGVIAQINPLVDDKGQINVRARVNNADGKLIEGMNVTVLVENLVHGQLVVPKSAVVIRDNQEVLFRLGPDGKAMWTYVNVVMSNSDSHVVAPNLDKGAELNAGDVIVTSGNLNLADGSQVEIRK